MNAIFDKKQGMIVGTSFIIAKDARFLANPRSAPPHYSHLHSFAPDKLVEYVLMREDVQLQLIRSVQRVRTSAIFYQTTTHHQHRTPPTHHDPTPTSIISATCTLTDTLAPTMIRSLSITVRSRCATVNTVQSRNCSRIERWISSSVLQTMPNYPSSSSSSLSRSSRYSRIVDVGRGFVDHQDATLLQYDSCQTHQLLLSNTQIRSALAHPRLQTIRHHLRHEPLQLHLQRPN